MNTPEQAKIQAMFDALFEGWQAERESNEEHWSLGRLTDALKALPSSSRVLVEFDSTALGYDGLGSYRGYYSDLCIEIAGTTPYDVSLLVEELESADGEAFEGYKGGNYRMRRSTALWVDVYGQCDGFAVTGIKKMDTVQAVGAPLYLITTQKKEY